MYEVLVWKLFQPFTLLILLSGVAVLNLWRKRRESRRRLVCLTAIFAALALLSLPIVGRVAVGSLEWQNPPMRDRPADAQAIVVLSSHVQPADDLHPEPELDEPSLNRCLRAARVYHQGPACPVLVSGGKGDADDPGPTCPEVMRNFLVQLGVRESDLILDLNSQSTYENAVESRKLLDDRQLHKIILITDAAHLVRATGCFNKQGLEVVPCGCFYRAAPKEGLSLEDFLPSLSAARGCARAFHEWLGLAWYRLRGRI
jgi:uncharacterized SAM-binding protein YcdF (DUF218 family)